jgi:hypothetical protein
MNSHLRVRLLGAILLLAGSASVFQGTALAGTPGTFRFLSTKIPTATRSSALSFTLLVANAAGEVTFSVDHVSVEVDIADKQYYAGVTLFAPKAGSYSTKMP